MAQGRDAGFADANHFLYLCKANQLAAVDPAKIKAPTLVLYAPNDLVFYEPIVRETMQKIATAKQGKTVHLCCADGSLARDLRGTQLDHCKRARGPPLHSL